MKLKIEFQRAVPADIDALIEVQNLAFYADYTEFGVCPGYNHSKESMAAILSSAYDFKILCDGKIVGNIIVRTKENDEYYLGELCVIPEYQNKGIGQQSICFLEREFPEAKLWNLITPAARPQNHYFYEKMGFVKTGECTDKTVRLFQYEKQMSKI